VEDVNTPGRIVLIRHGQTDWNREERLQGATDVPLNDVGRQEARAVAAHLRDGATPWDVLVSSPLDRAVETARIIGAVLGLELAGTCAELVERGFGIHEGSTLAGLEAQARERILAEGEPADAVARRGLSALRRIRAEHPGRNVLVVAHGSLIRLTVSELTGEAHPRVRNCEVVPVRAEALGDERLRHDASESTAP
jgi:uncharacterized phosphatase